MTLLTGELLARLAIDVAAIAVLAYAIYFRRHHDRDLFVVLTMFNVGLFVALQVIAAGTLSLGVGFGLFAILAILRLRSEPFGYAEMGYFFAALVLALVTGLDVGGLAFAIVLTIVVLVAATVADSPRLVRPMRRTTVTLETIVCDEEALERHLEERLNGQVIDYELTEIDFVRETTRALVRYRPNPPGTVPAAAMEDAADARWLAPRH